MHLLGIVNRWLLKESPPCEGFHWYAIYPWSADTSASARSTWRMPIAGLLGAVNRETVAFLLPSHPEFATDWLVDKEIPTLARCARSCGMTRGGSSLRSVYRMNIPSKRRARVRNWYSRPRRIR